MNGDCLIGCYAKLLLDTGELKKGDTVVGTIMSNLGLQFYLEELGLKFHRTQVGDRYIMEYMRESGAILGGEPSGHIIFKNHATTGDGSLAALRMMECLKYYSKSVKELTNDVKLFPQILKNAVVKEKPDLENFSSVKAIVNEVQQRLGARGRVVLRYSGTEPKVRVMVEAEQEQLVEQACDDILSVVLKEIG